MPANIQRLNDCFVAMKASYSANPTKAVRGQGFIHLLHSFCVTELENVGFERRYIREEVDVFGSHKAKKVDIAYIDPVNGPMIIIGVRSQMSSISKNILTYYEEIIGDCISLHDRFPMAVVNYVYLLPENPIKKGYREEPVNLARAEKLYSLITNRGDWRSTKDKYEHFAFLKVRFSSDPPLLLDTREDLSIHSFFDKIRTTFLERNYFLELQNRAGAEEADT